MAFIFSLERQLQKLFMAKSGTARCVTSRLSYWPKLPLTTYTRNYSTSLSNDDGTLDEKHEEAGYIHLTQPIRAVKATRSHSLVDITDESVDVSSSVLTPQEFLQAKQRYIITQEDYDNLKPHEVRKIIKATMKQEDLEKKFGKKLAKKIIKRRELDEHSKVNFNPREKVAETKIKELSADDIDIENRPRVEKFHFINKSIYDMTEDEFYGSFFRDRERRFDGMGTKLAELEGRILKHKRQDDLSTRTRISPREYWIKPAYVSPTVKEVASLNSMDLKFVMMNEARKAIATQETDLGLWDAFLIRVREISSRVCVRTLLRFLQIVSKVQIKPNDHVKALVDHIHSRSAEFKPKHYVFLFQALSRLRLRDQRLYDDIYEMILCWAVLRNNFIIKASNAISKLGVADSLLVQPLKQVIANRIDTFTATDCVRTKAITVLELFTDDMIVSFLNKCEYHRQHFRHYSRHLEIIELYLRLIKTEVYDKLEDATKQFLIDARKNTLSKKIPKHYNDARYEERNVELDGVEEMVTREETSFGSPSGCYAPPIFHCQYHEDISKTLDVMGIHHRNFMKAGAFTLDIYEPRSNTVIEINTEYQYYNGTTRLTAMARRRHEIISAMGFRLLHIPYRWWRQLEGHDAKVEALHKLLAFTN
ncbi:hypothetical protein BgAZ_300270 [Babesia gibsoni]|uniref:RAP domain-containing protein n=1 Tax=Babesia gibsoni TaxID=33632 RepID=A0AAD8LKI3_BABGI|nr:hypothetical protein BgAZ_300270 [Babesia gibsoni]